MGLSPVQGSFSVAFSGTNSLLLPCFLCFSCSCTQNDDECDSCFFCCCVLSFLTDYCGSTCWVYSRGNACVGVRTHNHTHRQVHTHRPTHTHTQSHTQTYTHMHRQTQIDTHTNTHTDNHIHTQPLVLYSFVCCCRVYVHVHVCTSDSN